ncbi:hypothetical protein HY734_03755 [Candidatus Uhrbacteria bacterium]|nr:hypothetical protein [Candidatus Uhrbacteria bacterium]
MRLFRFFHRGPSAGSRACLAVCHWSLCLLFFLLPVFFLPFTLDPLEINKQVLLIALVGVAALAWVGFLVSEGAFVFRRNGPSLFLLAFFLSVLVSTLVSRQGFTAWVGGSAQDYTSLLSFGACLVLFLILRAFPHRSTLARHAGWAVVLVGIISGTLGLLSLFRVFLLPFSFAQAQTFTTVGTLNAWGIFLCVATVLGFGLRLEETADDAPSKEPAWKKAGKGVCIALLSGITLLALAALDYWMLWTVLLVGIGILLIAVFASAKHAPSLRTLLLPMTLGVLALFLLFLPSPLRMDVPVEVGPSTQVSREVVRRTWDETSVLFGSGPGSFPVQFGKFQSAEANTTQFWNVRFDRASSHALTLLTTLGLLPVLFLTLFVLTLGFRASRQAFSGSPGWALTSGLLGVWIGLTLAACLYSTNMTLAFLFFGTSGLLASRVLPEPRSVPVKKSRGLGFALALLFVLAWTGVATATFVEAERYASEAALAEAVRLDRQNGSLEEVVSALEQATRRNRHADVAFRNLSHAQLLRVREVLASSPGANPSPETVRHVQALAAASATAAARATDAAPDRAANWLMRGTVSRELIPLVNGAGEAAIKAFKTAGALEPANPSTATELGKTFLVLAEQARLLTGSEDPDAQAEAKRKTAAYLEQAEGALARAVELKADYAPAHYQMAIVFEREGRLEEAVGKMESVARYNPSDVGVAFQLGLLYLRRGGTDDLVRAEAQFAHAIALAPAYGNAHWFLASIYERKGDIASAAREVEKVLELNPGNALVSSRLERLQTGQAAAELPVSLEESSSEGSETALPSAAN